MLFHPNKCISSQKDYHYSSTNHIWSLIHICNGGFQLQIDKGAVVSISSLGRPAVYESICPEGAVPMVIRALQSTTVQEEPVLRLTRVYWGVGGREARSSMTRPDIKSRRVDCEMQRTVSCQSAMIAVAGMELEVRTKGKKN